LKAGEKVIFTDEDNGGRAEGAFSVFIEIASYKKHP